MINAEIPLKIRSIRHLIPLVVAQLIENFTKLQDLPGQFC